MLVYRSPSCPTKKTEQLIKVIGDLIACDKICLICGDFNMPSINWTSTSPVASSTSSKALVDLCKSYGLTQYVRKATLGKHILDLVLCNIDSLITHLSVGPPIGTSDHCSISFNIDLVIHRSNFLIKKDYKKANFDMINEYLLNVDWYGSFSAAKSVNDKYELFISVLRHCIDVMVPTIKVPLLSPNLPFYLRSLAHKRTLAWESAVSTSSDADWELFSRLNKAFEKKLWKYNDTIEKKTISSSNKTAFYKLISSRIRHKSAIGALVSPNGGLARTDYEKAELLADAFEQAYCRNSTSPVHSVSEPIQ